LLERLFGYVLETVSFTAVHVRDYSMDLVGVEM